MKTLVLLIICFIVLETTATTDEELAIFTSNHEKCLETSAVDVTVLKRAFEGDVQDDINLKNYINCFFTKSGFQNESGEMRYDAIKSYITHMTKTNAGNQEDTIIACAGKKIAGEDPAETAFLNFKCYVGGTLE